MSAPNCPATESPRLLDQVLQAALGRFGRPEPGQRYVEWTAGTLRARRVAAHVIVALKIRAWMKNGMRGRIANGVHVDG
jgi:hypothetical protein